MSKFIEEDENLTFGELSTGEFFTPLATSAGKRTIWLKAIGRATVIVEEEGVNDVGFIGSFSSDHLVRRLVYVQEPRWKFA